MRGVLNYIGWMCLTGLLALTSCTADKGETVVSPSVPQPTQPVQTPIALSAYTAQQTAGTRADEGLLAEGGIPNNQSIGVYAYYHQGSEDAEGTWSGYETPNFMFNQQATNDADNDAFSYSPLKYWPNTNYDKLSFIGYYPHTTTFGSVPTEEDNGIALTKGSNDAGLPAFELKVSADVTKQVDFLISDLLTDLPNGTSAVSPSSATDRDHLTVVDKVRLLFHHATSKVTIRIAIDESIRQDFMSMTISGLEMTNIYRKGTVTPSYSSGTTTIGVTGASDSLTYTIVDAAAVPVVNHLTDTYLMLPQTLAYVEDDLTKTAKINLSYSITLRSHGTVYTYVDGNPVATDHYTYSNTASLPLAKLQRPSDNSEIDEWLPNHHYIYTIRLGAERIEFTGQVVKWGEEVPWDDIIVDQIGT